MAASFRSIPGKSIKSLIGMCVVVTMLGVTARGQSGNTTLTDGQTPLGLEPGAPAGAYALSGLDNVNLFNGNLNFQLPLMQIGGRGGAQMSMTFPIEVKWRVFHLFTPEIPPNPPSHTYLPFPSVWNPIQPGYGPGVLIGRKAGTEADCGTVIPPHIRYTLTRLTFISPDGTESELRDQLTQGKPADLGGSACSGGFNFGRGKVFVTADGSAMTFISDQPISDAVVYSEFYYPTGYLLLRDGTRFRIEEGLVKRITDRNGNWLNFTYDQYNAVTVITDSLNRIVNITYAETLDGFDQISWKGSEGSPRSIKVWRGLLGSHLRTGAAEGSSGYALKTLHELFPEIPGLDDTNDFDWPVFSSVELPDGRRYRFYYNSYAELARVELPTGGAYEYDFTPTSGVLWVEAIHRRVVERRVYPDGLTLEGKTIYSDTDVGNSSQIDVNHRDRNGNLLARERHYFNSTAALSMSPAIEAVCYAAYLDGKEYLTESYDTSGNVVRKLEQSYAQRAPVPWWGTWQGPACLGEPSNDTRLTEVITTLTDVTPNLLSKETYGYDQFNNGMDTWEWGFGQSSPPSFPVRHTRTNYLVVNQVNSIDYTGFDIGTPTNSIHLRSLPRDQFVYAVNQSTGADIQPAAAQTTFEYDKYDSSANHAPLVDRSGISGHDAMFDTGRQTRGNVTAMNKWVSTSGAFLSSYSKYDVAGNIVESVDPRANSTTVDFSDRFGIPDDESRNNVQAPAELGTQSTYAFPTRVTNAFGHTVYTQYDYYLGRPINGENANGVVTKGRYDDNLDRPTEMVVAENITSLRRRTLITYNDAGHTITTRSDQTYDDLALKTEGLCDGLGRTYETRTYETATTFITTKQEFDGLGRVSRSYNPFRSSSDETYGSTVTSYDSLGRVTKVETLGGSGASTGAITTIDQGNATTVVDQAGKKRRSVTDALGRLIRVDEPDSNGNLDDTANPPQPLQPTFYIYDALDDLVKVTQGVQSRFFMHDSLKRLIRVRTREQDVNTNLTPVLTDPTTGNSQWCAKYDYDANSNLLATTDARNITATYTYDALNRISSRAYSNDPQNTPAVTYKYDAQSLPTGFPAGFNRGYSTGRLVAVTYGGTSAGAYIGYDQIGRVTSSYQQTDAQNYGFTHGYNLAGAMISEGYPSGRTITMSYDLAGRLSGVNGQKSGEPNKAYASSFSYAAQSAISSVTFGNNLIEKTTFNSRLQPTFIKLGTTGNPANVVQLGYTYGVLVGGTLDTTKNNGNIQSETVAVGASAIRQSFLYDSLNRLQSAAEDFNQAAKWTQSYMYDRYANRTSLSNSGVDASLLPTSDTPSVDAATNRINQSGFVYDAAGNLKQEPGKSYDYDAENRQVKFNNGAVTYTYDGDGRRVKRVVTGNPTTTTLFVYSAAGQLIAEYTDATSSGSSGTSYLATDHLGSTRAVTNGSGGVVSRHDYLPYGEEIPSQVGGRSGVGNYGVADGVRQRFTGKERDTESGLDYFLARYYSPATGRFTSPDPKLASGTPVQPQGWNRYHYVINNPLRYSDPTGLDWWYQEGQTMGPVWFDKDPGGKWKRWSERFGYVYRITAGKHAGAWVALDPFNGRAYISADQARAVVRFQAFVSNRFGLIHGTQAEREFAAGFAEGISPLGPVAGWLHKKVGFDTSSRDYKGGVFIGILVLAGVNITADTVQALRATALGATARDAEMFGMLREAAGGKGNLGVGSATADEANQVGKAWVGEGYIVASDGKTLISADALRQYRPPSFKPDLGKTQANLEWRWSGVSKWQGNAHIDIH